MTSKPKEAVFKIWHVVISVVLWTVWLGKKELIFKNYRIKIEVLSELLVYRTFKWLETSDFMQEKYKLLWKVNPSRAIELYNRDKIEYFWSKIFMNFDYICSLDGALFKIE